MNRSSTFLCRPKRGSSLPNMLVKRNPLPAPSSSNPACPIPWHEHLSDRPHSRISSSLPTALLESLDHRHHPSPNLPMIAFVVTPRTPFRTLRAGGPAGPAPCSRTRRRTPGLSVGRRGSKSGARTPGKALAGCPIAPDVWSVGVARVRFEDRRRLPLADELRAIHVPAGTRDLG